MVKNKLVRVYETKRAKAKGYYKTHVVECVNPNCDKLVEVTPRVWNAAERSGKDKWVGCCRKCSQSQAAKDIRGIVNPFRTKEGQAKVKETLIKKYGVDNPALVDGFDEKSKATFLKKYGVDNPRKSPEIQEAMRQRCLEQYGCEYHFQREEVKAKIAQSQIDRYGCLYAQSDEFKFAMSLDGFIERYGDEEGRKRYEKMCDGRMKGLRSGSVSKLELSVVEAIKAVIPDINTQFKMQGENKNFYFDIEHNGRIVEVNGDFWHANPNKYGPEDLVKAPRKPNQTASDIWKHDKIKLDAAEKNGFKIFILWESDLYDDFDTSIANAITFLTN